MTLNSNLLPPVTVSLPFLVQHVAAKSMIKEPGSSAWTTGPHASALMLPPAQDRLCTKAQQRTSVLICTRRGTPAACAALTTFLVPATVASRNASHGPLQRQRGKH